MRRDGYFGESDIPHGAVTHSARSWWGDNEVSLRLTRMNHESSKVLEVQTVSKALDSVNSKLLRKARFVRI